MQNIASKKKFNARQEKILQIGVNNVLNCTALRTILIFGAAVIEGFNVFLLIAVIAELFRIHDKKNTSSQKLFFYFVLILIVSLSAFKNGDTTFNILSMSVIVMHFVTYINFKKPFNLRANKNFFEQPEQDLLLTVYIQPSGLNVVENYQEDIQYKKDIGPFYTLMSARNFSEFLACFNTETVHILRLAFHSVRNTPAPISVLAVLYNASLSPVIVKFMSLNVIKIYKMASYHGNTLNVSATNSTPNVSTEIGKTKIGRSVLSHTTIENAGITRSNSRSSIAM